ncbi:tyrosine-type recombinase/integrase [Candidatus Bathyarchaeota archaeon]|nr:tyrosine-type recombinase/integrase [Candidatus Bathyarchaeota archaeon]
MYVLFKAALRPGKILSMNVGSVEFKDKYCLIAVNGKTEIKRIPLVVSYQPLLEWLKSHPYRDSPEAPLWPSLSTNYKGKRLSYRHFRLIIKRLAKKAGLKKDVALSVQALDAHQSG